ASGAPRSPTHDRFDAAADDRQTTGPGRAQEPVAGRVDRQRTSPGKTLDRRPKCFEGDSDGWVRRYVHRQPGRRFETRLRARIANPSDELDHDPYLSL